jgi:hypothetical protein
MKAVHALQFDPVEPRQLWVPAYRGYPGPGFILDRLTATLLDVV